tara:strand:+ start:975 stop:1730 length:756 start_codon:yes stop_codon:yes gene_type:complete
MNLKLENKSVVVIGGSRGIGLSIVEGFLDEKARVSIIARNISDKLKSQLIKEGNQVNFYEGDATDKKSLISISKLILKKSQDIDVVVANVGNGKASLASLQSDNDWEESWNINFKSALNSANIFLPIINTLGSFTFISSIAGKEYLGAPNSYSVAKSAINTLMKSFSHKFGSKLRVNTISPGNVIFKKSRWEELLTESPEKVKKMLEVKVPLKRFGTPEEIANAVVFVSSPRASFISGACIDVDGGQTISY